MEKIYLPWVHDRSEEYAWLDDFEPEVCRDMSWKVFKGVTARGEFPEGMTFELSPRHGPELADSIPNVYNYYIVSERLKELLEKTGASFEFFQVSIRNRKKRIEKQPFYVANLLDVVDCMDREKSVFEASSMDPSQALFIEHLVLDHSKIPEDKQIFRLGSERQTYIVRRDLAYELFRVHNCRGMIFKKIEAYGEEWRGPSKDADDGDEES